jgi:hypothetical protein
MDQHAAGPVEARERATAVKPRPSFAAYYWFSFISPAVLAGRKAAVR